MSAEKIALEISRIYSLAYKTQVNLETTINGLLDLGLTEEKIVGILHDIYSSLAFIMKVEE